MDMVALNLASGRRAVSRPQLMHELGLSQSVVCAVSKAVRAESFAMVRYSPPCKRAPPRAARVTVSLKRKRASVDDGVDDECELEDDCESDDALDGTGVACAVCGEQEGEEGNDILLCDGHGCSAGYHLRCLQPALEAVPEHEWLCPSCSVSGQNHFIERILSHSGVGARRRYRVRSMAYSRLADMLP